LSSNFLIEIYNDELKVAPKKKEININKVFIMFCSILKLIMENTSPNKLPITDEKNINKLSDQNLASFILRRKKPNGIEKIYEIIETIKKVIGNIFINANIVSNSNEDLIVAYVNIMIVAIKPPNNGER